ncbi:MAG: DNA2/NAM7 family helicase [Prevotella sp.]|nr:DNA2/NAM7 family helicase [Prevotella sp.]
MKVSELFERCVEIVQAEPSVAVLRYMHETLVLACAEALKGSGQGFGNLMAQTDYLCKQAGIGVADRIAIQTMRRHSNRKDGVLTRQDLRYDVRALALFISAVFNEDIPHELVTRIPTNGRPTNLALHINQRYVRCVVSYWDEKYIYATTDEGSVCIQTDDETLRPLLTEGMQLNLLDCHREGQTVLPKLIVVEPDFLMDISSLAACFMNNGHSPLSYTLRRLIPSANTQPILLGNFAGAALDDIINQTNYHPYDTIRNSFREQALQFCTCTEFNPQQFKEDALRQVENIKEAVKSLTPNPSPSERGVQELLEPSFVCEHLGLQGRVDLMTSDKHLLVEQKSGKNWNLEHSAGLSTQASHLYAESHYVQLLLYYGILRYNFHLSADKVDIRLLYSRYPAKQGLLVVNYYQQLFHEAIRLRNQIVAQEIQVAKKGFSSIQSLLNINSLKDLPETAQNYIERMMTFVYREQLAQKVGTQEGQGRAVANLWNMPLTEKRDSGCIFYGLRMLHKEQSSDYSGYDRLTLSIPDMGDDFLPNFRRNDMVCLYAYDDEPSICHAILYKGVIERLTDHEVVVRLNDGQQNPEVFEDTTYAIEPTFSDMGTTSAIRSLHALCTAEPERRALLLGEREPRRDETLQLSRSYHPHYDDILLKAKQARDYFLLQGPPGTGKTSMALRFLVEEECLTPIPSPSERGETERFQYANPDIYSILKENARKNRKEPTDAENLLWQILRNNGIGFKFRRQHAIGDYIVDFISIEHLLIIEIDGKYHEDEKQQEKDRIRSELLQNKGYKILRFTNEEVINNTPNVLRTILSATPSLKERAGGEALLLSYTNRAVDEICGMLEEAGIDYLRLGSDTSCDPRFAKHLLDSVVGEHSRMDAIRQRIIDTKVIVSTTSTMQSRPYLFQLKHFSLCIVDEASQILEPNVIGLLASPQVDKFILIGDHKQLPAVVQQPDDIPDLSPCRLSLFERLLRVEQKAGRTAFMAILRRQGRMHPDIAAFPNEMFYAEEQLQPVPLPHQEEGQLEYPQPSQDQVDDLLKQHRVIFFPSDSSISSSPRNTSSPNPISPSDKVNPSEAHIVADLLRRIYRQYGADRFDTARTVGVIVPYRNQIAMIRREIEQLDIPALLDISIDTVERYQGSQRDVIIYSFTIQHPYQLDFLTANCFESNGKTIDRKLNVAMTRARKQLLMTGNVEVLSQNPLFRELIRRYSISILNKN